MFSFPEMSVSPSPENIRICLIGDLADDEATVDAAKTFNVPIVNSETGTEIIEDTDWVTYFVMRDFEGPTFDAIRKTNHK